jgi:ligand-binding SRPBCC domain-containing protein
MQVPLPLEVVFKFFEDPHNLARITPPNLSFKVTTRDVEMREGALIDYEIRWLRLPMRWRTRITLYQPPQSFQDEQLRGPYKLWRHHHGFREVNGAAVISDRVEYELPWGILGQMAHALIVGRQLRGIFAYRQRAIAAILGVPGVKSTDPIIRPLATL